MGFLKIDKGMPVADFFFYFLKLTIKISILTNFHGHTLILTEIMGFCCLSLFWSKITSFLPKKSHSAAGENRRGPKIVMQTWFLVIY